MKETLQAIRHALGFRSARAFHLDLQKKAELNFNYSYYSKIEQGKVTPSPQVIQTICSLLPDEWADRLVLAYCASLFPDRQKLFRQEGGLGEKSTSPPISTQKTPSLLSRQRILTERQVSILSKSKNHYFAFLVFTLARTPITSLKLQSALPEGAHTQHILEELARAKLITDPAPDQWVSTSKEMRFPKGDSPSLRAVYQKLDLWDGELATHFHFKKLERRILIRRISPRYIGLILELSHSLQELLRASDEVQPALNEDVLSFRLEIHQGKLPG